MKNKLFSSGTDITCSTDAAAACGASSDALTYPASSVAAMNFSCSLEQDDGKSCWDASIRILFCSSRICEAVAEGRSTTFHFIAGHYRDGNFLCVPSHGFGCELSSLTDTFWNSERIRKHLCPVDSATLVAAIACLDVIWPYSRLHERRHYA